MTVSTRDRSIIRDLARRVAEIAALPEQAEKARLWTACNDLKPERAMVFVDQFSLKELANATWLKLECEDESLRGGGFTTSNDGIERALRIKILRHEHIPDDFPILNTFNVGVHISKAGYDDYGIKLLATESNQNEGAYKIEPVIQSEKDIEKLHFRPIRVDHESTDHAVERANELLGDILKVRKVGKTLWRYGLTRVLIHMRGLNNMMLDMYDKPELIHRLMTFLLNDKMREIDLFEQENAVSLNNTEDNITGSGGLSPTADIPGKDFDGTPRVKHCICWGESQETIGVGPAQFDEFVLQYQLPLMNRFGLVDYGCCEPLDYKLDLLIKKIPKLRWVAVSPWADREICAERIGNKYVYVYKPNPSHICLPKPNWEAAEQDIRKTLEIARGCAVHIVMKDIKTTHNQPERLTKWAKLALQIVKEMA